MQVSEIEKRVIELAALSLSMILFGSVGDAFTTPVRTGIYQVYAKTKESYCSACNFLKGNNRKYLVR